MEFKTADHSYIPQLLSYGRHIRADCLLPYLCTPVDKFTTYQAAHGFLISHLTSLLSKSQGARLFQGSRSGGGGRGAIFCVYTEMIVWVLSFIILTWWMTLIDFG